MFNLFKILLVSVSVLLSVAFLVLGERKTIGYIQKRKGPVFVGFLGLLQPISDGLKLILKDSLNVFGIERFFYVLSPFLVIFLSLFTWAFIPTSFLLQDSKFSLLFIIVINSMSVYGVLLAGLSSSSK
jgi:NADH:ubiquinone oxidoreductase subunit H